MIKCCSADPISGGWELITLSNHQMNWAIFIIINHVNKRRNLENTFNWYLSARIQLTSASPFFNPINSIVEEFLPEPKKETMHGNSAEILVEILAGLTAGSSTVTGLYSNLSTHQFHDIITDQTNPKIPLFPDSNQHGTEVPKVGDGRYNNCI